MGNMVDEIVADLFDCDLDALDGETAFNTAACVASESITQCNNNLLLPPIPSPQQLLNDCSLSSDDTVCSQLNLNLAPPQVAAKKKRISHNLFEANYGTHANGFTLGASK